MRILLIDDLRNFRRSANRQDAVIARTSQEALAILAQGGSWDEIWLDHDLGEVEDASVEGGVRVDTIMPVVDYLSEQAFNDTPVDVGIVYVHSSNPVGVKQMLASLTRYGYAVSRQAPESIFIVGEEAEEVKTSQIGSHSLTDPDDSNSVAIKPAIRVSGANSEDEAYDIIAMALDYWNSMQDEHSLEMM